MRLPFFCFGPPDSSTKEVAITHGACHACRKPMPCKELKTCKKCYRVNYCSAACQRTEWPQHKLTCNQALDNNTTIRLGRRLVDHTYFHAHLLLYALRSIGPPKFPDEDHPFLLMVIVDMIPLFSSQIGTKHVCVKNILAVPVCIVPPEVVDMQRVTRRNFEHSPVHCVWIVTIGIYPEGKGYRFRLAVLGALNIMVSSAHLPHFSMDLRSRSHGVLRRVNLDMDFIFESINDELRLDVDNYYQLQG
ncbi:hypothetical protein C8R44DRAFT_92842 [Mycena epipterygia]|nr:hypothetical protein C8R44DRAFT_92842 [Mycena epipterygia]